MRSKCGQKKVREPQNGKTTRLLQATVHNPKSSWSNRLSIKFGKEKEKKKGLTDEALFRSVKI
jgi:hypothetical protein